MMIFPNLQIRTYKGAKNMEKTKPTEYFEKEYSQNLSIRRNYRKKSDLSWIFVSFIYGWIF